MIAITGMGAICAAGREPTSVWEAVRDGRSAITPIRGWDAAGWPCRLAGEVADYNPGVLAGDRKTVKFIRRTHVLGLYAAGAAIAAAGFLEQRAASSPAAAEAFNDRSAVYVGSGGNAYQDQYDFFPPLARAGGDLAAFGRAASQNVSPMWLLQTLPNNVLCHIGIRYGFSGPNACIVNHSVSGALAVAEAVAALRAGTADRAVVVAHEAPVEPQTIQAFAALGLLAAAAVRPFDRRRDGCLLGEGAGALALEPLGAARARGATVLGAVLGSGAVTEGGGLLDVRPDGDGLARAIAIALDDASLAPGDVGMIAAHGNGTRASDASEAAAIHRVFGADVPPVTAFKWAFGHLLAGSGLLDAVLAVESLRQYEVPGIATLREIDRECEGIRVSTQSQRPRGDVALVLSRGFAGTNAALVVRAQDGQRAAGSGQR